MEIRPLPADEPAVRRYVEELWLPYHRTLERTVERHALADDVDLVPEETEFRLDYLSEPENRAWVAVETGDDAFGDPDIAAGDGELAGFVTTSVDESPSVFERPKRQVVGDIFVREQYRGAGLARDLVARVVAQARANDCDQLRLDVDVDNDRALAFYEKLGFEPYRHKMVADVEAF